MTMTKRNLGVFRIDIGQIESRPDAVAQIFSMLKIVPIKAEYRPDWNAVEYLAISPHFEELPKHGAAPEYILRVTKGDTGNVRAVDVEKI